MGLLRWIVRMFVAFGTAAAAVGAAAQVPPGRAAITLFEHESFQGAMLGLEDPAPDFRALQFNDTASSVIVRRGQWMVCQDVHYRGRCIVLGPGRYPSLREYDLNDAIS